MRRDYHSGRALAIIAGVAATAGALAILLADPVMTGGWRLDHVLLPLIVAITIAAGHLCGSALWGWRLLPAAGFATIFLIGTALTVYSSVGAQKSGADAQQVASAASHNAMLADKRAELARARQRSEQASQMADREAGAGGCGRRCNDWKLRAKEVDARILQLEGELQRLGAEHVAPSRARPFAEAMGVMGWDVETVYALAATFEPFAFSLLFELTAIVAFSYGFGHSRPSRTVRVPAPPAETVPAPVQPPTPPKGTRGRKPNPEIIRFADRYRERHGHGPSGRELRQQFPDLPRSTAYENAKRFA